MVWKPHVTVATVVPSDGRYLFVVERVRGETVINQPAGHLDPGETLIDAARRETREETAYDVEIKALLGLYQWKSAGLGRSFLRVAFVGEVVDHDPAAPLDKGILEATWLTRGELEARHDEHRSPMVLRNVLDYEAGRRFPLDLVCALHV